MTGVHTSLQVRNLQARGDCSFSNTQVKAWVGKVEAHLCHPDHYCGDLERDAGGALLSQTEESLMGHEMSSAGQDFAATKGLQCSNTQVKV